MGIRWRVRDGVRHVTVMHSAQERRSEMSASVLTAIRGANACLRVYVCGSDPGLRTDGWFPASMKQTDVGVAAMSGVTQTHAA